MNFFAVLAYLLSVSY